MQFRAGPGMTVTCPDGRVIAVPPGSIVDGPLLVMDLGSGPLGRYADKKLRPAETDRLLDRPAFRKRLDGYADKKLRPAETKTDDASEIGLH